MNTLRYFLFITSLCYLIRSPCSIWTSASPDTSFYKTQSSACNPTLDIIPCVISLLQFMKKGEGLKQILVEQLKLLLHMMNELHLWWHDVSYRGDNWVSTVQFLLQCLDYVVYAVKRSDYLHQRLSWNPEIHNQFDSVYRMQKRGHDTIQIVLCYVIAMLKNRVELEKKVISI